MHLNVLKTYGMLFLAVIKVVKYSYNMFSPHFKEAVIICEQNVWVVYFKKGTLVAP